MSNEIIAGWGECSECKHEHYTRHHGPACPICDCDAEFTPAPSTDQRKERFCVKELDSNRSLLLDTEDEGLLAVGMSHEIANHNASVLNALITRINSLEAELEEAEQEEHRLRLVLMYYAGVLAEANLLTDEVLNWQPQQEEARDD